MQDRPTILIVDDHETTRYILRRNLLHAGYAVAEAGSGSEMMRLLTAREEEYDLIILDVNLPGIDGFKLSREVRANVNLQHLPILMASAYRVTAKDYITGLEQGADAYLTHPIEPDVLIATVHALLRIRKAEAQVRQLNATLSTRTNELRELNAELEARVAQRTKELEDSRAQLAYQAHHDVLTGLPNRAAFQHEARKRTRYAQHLPSSSCLAVMIIDLDGLKRVNDSMGHARGDALLRTFAEGLVQTFQADGTVYRLGGDEYVVLLSGVSLNEDQALRERVQTAVNLTVEAGFPECAASSGAAFFPQESLVWSDLMRLADQRMYQEKQEGKLLRRDQ